MSALDVDDNSMQISKDFQNTNPLSLVGHLQYAQKDSGSESTSPVYEGFTFSKAMPKESATWRCVKRIVMHLNQEEYFKMVQKRANKKSVALQYQSLSSDTRRAHINQLIDEQRHNNPLVEWSCVYIKEHKKVFKGQHARRGDYETVSMDVIIMQTPMKTQAYSRAAMSGLVAIGKHLRPDTNDSPKWPQSQHRDHPPTPDQNGYILRTTPQLLSTELAPAMSPLARLNSIQHPAYPDSQFGATHPNIETSHPAASAEQMHESARATATINNRLASLAFSATNSSSISLGHTSDYSSENSNSDDASMLSDQSDESSATDDPESMETETETETETECQEPQQIQASLRQQNASPYRRELIYGPHPSRKSQSRSLDRRHDRTYPPRDQLEVSPAKNFSLRRAETARSGSVPGKRYRMQLINDNEIRSRMLDHREASLGHREKWLKRTLSEARRQPVKNVPATCRCTCRCAIKEKRETA
ncbi:hypothetical protein N7445_008816 [Penicillium cf. griseofulvum]|nr:hypothetical protein N7445_008816 [Penicillium cf. griseofulvum]